MTTPRKITFFSDVLAEIEVAAERAELMAHRAELIEKADNRCQARNKHGAVCGWLAWTPDRQAQLALRPKLAIAGNEAEGDWVLCPECQSSYDRKHPAKQRRAS